MANVLIADDSIMMRKSIRLMLEKAGHKILAEAVNGKQAYLSYIIFKPDIVTLDISMPEEDGITAVKKIMKHCPNAKIIMISAIQQKNMVYDAIKNGATSYILKPVTEEKLISTINKII